MFVHHPLFRFTVLVALVLCASCANEVRGRSDFNRLTSIMLDRKSTDAEAFAAMNAAAPLSKRSALISIWQSIVSDRGYSDARRRWALLKLFSECVRPGMTVAEISRITRAPTWINRKLFFPGTPDMESVETDDSDSDTEFDISFGLPHSSKSWLENDTGVAISLVNYPSPDSVNEDDWDSHLLLDALAGKNNAVSQVRLRDISLFLRTDPKDWQLMSREWVSPQDLEGAFWLKRDITNAEQAATQP